MDSDSDDMGALYTSGREDSSSGSGSSGPRRSRRLAKQRRNQEAESCWLSDCDFCVLYLDFYMKCECLRIENIWTILNFFCIKDFSK